MQAQGLYKIVALQGFKITYVVLKEKYRISTIRSLTEMQKSREANCNILKAAIRKILASPDAISDNAEATLIEASLKPETPLQVTNGQRYLFERQQC